MAFCINEEKINQNHIILKFFDFDFDPDKITTKLGLEPFSTAKKGEEYFLGKQKTKKTWEFNHWDFELKTRSNNFIGNAIDDFF